MQEDQFLGFRKRETVSSRGEPSSVGAFRGAAPHEADGGAGALVHPFVEHRLGDLQVFDARFVEMLAERLGGDHHVDVRRAAARVALGALLGPEPLGDEDPARG